MIRKHIKTILFFILLMALSACRSSKQIASSTTGDLPKNTAVLVENVESQYSKAKAITAKVKFTVTTGSKDFTTSGQLRMKQDDVIQLLLKDPFLGAMEVARLEITTQKVLLVDRYNHRYAEADYSDAGFLQTSGLGFYALQAIFRNQLFQPTLTGEVDANLYKMSSPETGVAELSCTGGVGLRYTFLVNTTDNKLTETDVEGSSSTQRVQVACKYSDFRSALSTKFPHNMELVFTGNDKKITCTLALSDIKENDSWEDRTTLNKSKYTEISIDKLINILKGL
jgi:hypothetical protein